MKTLQQFNSRVARLTMRIWGLLKTQSPRSVEFTVNLIKQTPLGATFEIVPKFKHNTLLSVVRSYIKSSDKELFAQLQSLKFDPKTNVVEVVFKKPEFKKEITNDTSEDPSTS